MWVWIKANWERVFLFLIAATFLVFSIDFIRKSEVTGATATFVMFFLCLIYSNVSRFKRFKGLGFEAELWEDKQKEAESLIQQLKSIVEVYTREIVMMNVMAGRVGGGDQWSNKWKLFEELITQLGVLGLKIDFQPLKDKVYRVMVFDAILGVIPTINSALRSSYEAAEAVIRLEFPEPISDPVAYKKRIDQLRAIDIELKDLFEVSKSHNLARYVLDIMESARTEFQEKFNVDTIFPPVSTRKIKRIDQLFEKGDFFPEPDLIRMADRED